MYLCNIFEIKCLFIVPVLFSIVFLFFGRAMSIGLLELEQQGRQRSLPLH